MAILTLQQPNASQAFFIYSTYSYIERTSDGWYVVDDNNGVIYGEFNGTGITYNGENPSSGIVSSATSLDETGAIKWTVSGLSLSANNVSSMKDVLRNGNPFATYMLSTILKGNDTINGSFGDDVIFYSSGSDTIDGGTGNDWMNFSTLTINTAALDVNLTTGIYKANVSGTIISSTLNNIENIVGTGSADTLTGNAGNNVFIGGKGNDSIDGRTGVDTVSYVQTTGVNANLMTGIAVEKYISSTNTDSLTAIENLIGSAYNDTLTGNAGNNILAGGAGDDSLDGLLGIDTADFSTAYKSVTVNLITGSATGQGTDSLNNIENVNGSTYDDTLIGNAGANTLDGKGGNDIVNGGAGNDSLIGGLGIDQANYDTAASAVTVNLAIKKAQNTIGAGRDTLSDIEDLLGSDFNDNLTGDAFDNTLNGGLGNDTLVGASGNDVLIGGAGKDTMTGGQGNDSFVFNATGDSVVGVNADVITDFEQGIDKINLAAIDADVFSNGNQAFVLISANAAFSSAGQIKLDAGNLYGEVTGDGIADFQVALTGVAGLTVVDFVL